MARNTERELDGDSPSSADSAASADSPDAAEAGGTGDTGDTGDSAQLGASAPWQTPVVLNTAPSAVEGVALGDSSGESNDPTVSEEQA